MLFTSVFLLVVLVFCWCEGDVRIRTKLFFTLLFIAHWFLLYWSPAAVLVTQCILIAVIGTVTFGIGFLTRRVR
jgi:hypothetical protein